MKPSKETAVKNKVKIIKIFKPLDKRQLETVVRGTVTNVQSGAYLSN